MYENQSIGAEQFFQDSVLKLNLLSYTNTVSECVQKDAQQIVNLSFKTKCEHELIFNSNLNSEGIKRKSDNHGLVMIFVCGTLHTKESIIGVYKQVFALASDPYSENNKD